MVVQLVAAEANGEKVVHSSPASDMWALGVLAYEMFAGYALALSTTSCLLYTLLLYPVMAVVSSLLLCEAELLCVLWCANIAYQCCCCACYACCAMAAAAALI